jgi:hypothetical protein
MKALVQRLAPILVMNGKPGIFPIQALTPRTLKSKLMTKPVGATPIIPLTLDELAIPGML